MINFKNKNIVITGAAQGIGLELLKNFALQGANVIGIDVKDSINNIGLQSDKYTGKVIGFQQDLSKAENIQAVCHDVLQQFEGRVDVLINNAGVIYRGDVLTLDEQHWHTTMQINVSAVYLFCKNFAPSMIKNGGGKIINLASILSQLGGYQAAAYSASKGAILQLTRSLANEWGQHNVQVNCLAPGYFSTEMNEAIMNSERKKQFEDRIPAQRWGLPEDLVGPAFFLASSLSDYVNGIILNVDGGAINR